MEKKINKVICITPITIDMESHEIKEVKKSLYSDEH